MKAPLNKHRALCLYMYITAIVKTLHSKTTATKLTHYKR